MTEVVLIWLCQQRLEGRECSTAEVHYPNGITMLLLHYVHHAVRKRALEMGFQIWLLGFVPKINLAGNCDLDQTWVGTGICYPPSG